MSSAKAKSREKSSIKLPEFMLEMARQPGLKGDFREECADVVTNRHLIEKSVTESLVAWYGPKMPKICLTEDGKHLVMNIHIFKDHAEALRLLPLVETKNGLLKAKWEFLKSTMVVVLIRIKSLLDHAVGGRWMHVPSFRATVMADRVMMLAAAGERATIERLWLAVRVTPEDIEEVEVGIEDRWRAALIPSWPIKVDDKLFSLGFRDEHSQRSIYFNIVASDHFDSLRLAPFMVEIAQSATKEEADDLARAKSPHELFSILCQHIHGSLQSYHRHHEPQVFVGKDDNQADLVINVALHIEHAPMLPKCFPGYMILTGFSLVLLQHFQTHLMERHHSDDIEVNVLMIPLCDGKPREMGRRATSDEIYSLLFCKKGSQPSYDHLEKRLGQFFEQNNIRMGDRKETLKHIRINFPYSPPLGQQSKH